MTDFKEEGFKIDALDLSGLSPGPEDDHRVYNHDGTSVLTLTDGSTTGREGWYMWSDPDSAWFPMGQHADLVDGYHGADLAALAENETVTGTWDFGARPTVNGITVTTTDHEHSFTDINGSVQKSMMDHDYHPVSIPVTRWASGLASEEIQRISVPTGKKLYVYGLEVALKGGATITTPSNLTVEVYDSTNAVSVASDAADGAMSTGTPIGSSGDGAEVLIRITNSTGSDQKASIQANMVIK